MELRHLRYFVAIAEEGSFTQAAEKRLHTAQPSLSRQIKDLETELGVTLIDRGPRGMALTPAGKVFLDHARAILLQTEAAAEAARRAARPMKTSFTVGFLSGHELEWLPKVTEILGDAITTIELIIHSSSSPDLMQSLTAGKMDLAFVRPEEAWGLAFKLVASEPLFALMAADHPLAKQKSVRPADLAGQAFVNLRVTYAPVLREVIDAYLAREQIAIRPAPDIEGLPMAISMVLSTGGICLLPVYTQRLLPPTVVGRPLAGAVPAVPLAMGYNTANLSPLLKLFLERADTYISAPSRSSS